MAIVEHLLQALLHSQGHTPLVPHLPAICWEGDQWPAGHTKQHLDTVANPILPSSSVQKLASLISQILSSLTSSMRLVQVQKMESKLLR